MYKITRCADNQTWDQRCVHYRTQTGQLFPISRQPLTLVIGQLLPHGSRMKAHSTPPPCGFMDFYFINKLWVDWHGMCASCASSQTASGNRKTTLSTQIGHPPTQQVLIYYMFVPHLHSIFVYLAQNTRVHVQKHYRHSHPPHRADNETNTPQSP